MSLNKVNYFKLNPNFYDLTREVELEEDYDYFYKKCPVWKHKIERTYLMSFPIDLEFHLDYNENKIVIDYCSVNEKKLIELTPKEQLIMISHPNDLYGKTPVVQIELPKYLFWCDQSTKDIWIEELDHPLTSLNNNFVTIGGWFNLSNYNRVMSLGIKIIDKHKSVVLKKGDPVARIRLYSDDLNSGCKLVEKKISKEEFNLLQNYTANIRRNMLNDKNVLNSTLFGKSQKKCPFGFLFK